jgi:hypothetical protein
MNCRFAHTEDPNQPVMAGAPMAQQPDAYGNFGGQMGGGQMGAAGGNNYGRSRGVCYDWQKGICQRGDNCRFTHDQNAPAGPAYGAQGFGGGYGNVRPGDWTCPACQINNFASRIQCFKCSTPKDAQPGQLGVMAGPPPGGEQMAPMGY